MAQSTENDTKYLDILVEIKEDIKKIKEDVSSIDKRLVVVETKLDNIKTGILKDLQDGQKVMFKELAEIKEKYLA